MVLSRVWRICAAAFQVKLLESLEWMDEETYNIKFGGVLTYTTVSGNKTGTCYCNAASPQHRLHTRLSVRFFDAISHTTPADLGFCRSSPRAGQTVAGFVRKIRPKVSSKVARLNVPRSPGPYADAVPAFI